MGEYIDNESGGRADRAECHIVQQLAYAGVKRYFLIDPDRVDRSNLNRFIIATEKDLGRLKVEVARDYIERVQPGAGSACRR